VIRMVLGPGLLSMSPHLSRVFLLWNVLFLLLLFLGFVGDFCRVLVNVIFYCVFVCIWIWV
jgi:hypothetical protein